MTIDLNQTLFAIIFGSCIGSFLNVLIWRLPRNESPIQPRSYCPKCKSQIHWYENIPLLSWLIQQGRCRSCKQRISVRYPFIEILCAALYICCNFAVPNSLSNNSEQFIRLAGWIFVPILITLSVIDIDKLWLPESLCRLGFFSGLFIIIVNGFNLESNYSASYYLDHLVAIIIAYFGFEVVRIFSHYIFHKPALGRGDSKLAAVLGIWLGINGLAISIMITFILAGLYVMVLLILNRAKNYKVIPLGPFLSIGALSVWFLGNDFWFNVMYILNQSIFPT